MPTDITGNRVYNGTSAYGDLSKAARAAYDGAKSRVNKTDNHSFQTFRVEAVEMRETFLQRKAARNREIENIRKTYQKDAANARIKELMSAYADDRSVAVANLKTMLQSIVEYRKTQLNNYITQPMNADTLSLLQGLQLRSGSGGVSLGTGKGRISATELAMVLEKCGANYQSLAALKAIANANGFDFAMPVDPDRYLAELNLAEMRVNALLDEFDNESTNYYATEFFDADKYESTTLGDMFAALDDINNAISAEAAPSVYRLFMEKAEEHRQRLAELNREGDILAAQQAARQMNELKNFANNNRSVLETPEQHRDAVMQQAEELLTRDDSD